jgi:chemotaxis protein CheX
MDVVIAATESGVEVTGVKVVPIGASRVASARHGISVMVGLVGAHSGNVTMNLSERAMFHLAGQMLGEPQTELTEDNIDAIMEVGNMLAGTVKDRLTKSDYNISEISLPSMIFGNSYSVMYARGITAISVEFEIPSLGVSLMNDRFLCTTISLLRGSGRRK